MKEEEIYKLLREAELEKMVVEDTKSGNFSRVTLDTGDIDTLWCTICGETVYHFYPDKENNHREMSADSFRKKITEYKEHEADAYFIRPPRRNPIAPPDHKLCSIRFYKRQ